MKRGMLYSDHWRVWSPTCKRFRKESPLSAFDGAVWVLALFISKSEALSRRLFTDLYFRQKLPSSWPRQIYLIISLTWRLNTTLITRSKQYSSHSVIKLWIKAHSCLSQAFGYLLPVYDPQYSSEYWLFTYMAKLGQPRRAIFHRPQVAPIPEVKTTNSGQQKNQEAWDKTLMNGENLVNRSIYLKIFGSDTKNPLQSKTFRLITTRSQMKLFNL